MTTTLTNAAETSLIVLIFDDGERITRELTIGRGRAQWDKAMHAFGKEFASTS